MASRGGHLQCPFHIFLAHDIPQVREAGGAFFRFPDRGGREPGLAAEMGYQGVHVRNAVDGQPARQCGLGCIFGGDEQLADARRLRGHGHGQHAGDAPEGPGEGQLADEGGVGRQLRQVTACRQDAHENGQVVDRARFFLPGGSQIDGDTADGELGAAVFHRRPDPLPGLPHGGVRQAHHIESGESSGEEALRADLVTGDSAEAQRTHRHYHNFHASRIS